ncbi:4-azaleucine resistance probable transporter AzlC [Natronoarchaeum philippinense]|uniref:4-azaleucine resistance probable transporter AzlC n=1 Tax=Natronoarchaeum philippinense TaxID=558529 RepID=A0A285NRU4_NATPI|nr:AzlC family ABC transporter permease [Natronoarchaeum philippinense]SNZ12189.1 4-azaleucine resistance probable transporter AzlC [Natronoarchaeum philippinense]
MRSDSYHSTDSGDPTAVNDAPTGSDDERADHERSVTFTRSGLRDGFIKCVPVSLGVAGYGVAFGVLAQQAGLSVAEATLMSATVVAGAAQVIAVELWADPIPAALVVGTAFIVNLRYTLMGAALRPWLRELTPLQAYGSVFFMADENWALTMGELQSGSRKGAFLLGSGLAIWAFWIGSTVLGATAGAAVGEPSRYGLDFVLVAVFLAIAVELWDGASDLAPWGAALLAAVLGAQLLPGSWYIPLGGVAGFLVEVIRVES